MSVKRDRFIRCVERRTNRILRNLRLLGNCSRRGAYEYSPSDVRRIFKAINDAVAETRELFEPARRADVSFELADRDVTHG